jgi:peptide/nickel transport system substrate-binding protein
VAEDENYWLRRRVRRRSFLYGGAAAMGGAVVIACGDDDDGNRDTAGGPAPTPTTPATQVQPAKRRRGGTLRLLWDVVEAQVDPHSTTQHLGAELWRSVSHGLLKQEATTEQPIADLAEKWESPDPLTYVFHLDARAKWQDLEPVDGRPVVADDIVFSLKRISTPGPSTPRANSFNAIDTVTATSAQEVTIKLKYPFVPILAPLSDKWTAIVPREVAEKFGDLKGGDSLIGCGAFMLKDIDFSSGITLVRNPNYWKPGLPYLDQIAYKVVTDAEAQRAAFQSGQCDISPIIPALLAGSMKSDDVDILELPPGGVGIGVFGGLQDRPPFNDERIRKAINLAVDRDELARAAFPGAKYRIAGVFSNRYWGLPADQVAQLPGYGKKKDSEIKEATDLVNAAGKTGTEITMVTTGEYASYHLDRAEALVPMLEKIGLKIQLDVVEYAVFKDREARKAYEMTGGVYTAFGDPDTPLTNSFTSNGTRNYFNYSDTKYDELVAAQRSIIDVNERKQAIFDLQEFLLQGTPVAFHSWFMNSYIGVHKKVHGFKGTLLAGSSNMGWFHSEMWVDA